MLLNCDVVEDSWEPLGLQGDPTSPFWRSALGFLWREWCWSWNSSTLGTSCKELTHWKRPWSCEGLAAGEGTTEDEMVGWHHQLNGHGFEWTPGVGDGQGDLACCSSWVLRVGHDWVTELSSSNIHRYFTPLACVCVCTRIYMYLVFDSATSRDYSPPCSSIHGISRQEYWNVLPFHSSGNLPNPGIKPTSAALAGDSLPLRHLGSFSKCKSIKICFKPK